MKNKIVVLALLLAGHAAYGMQSYSAPQFQLLESIKQGNKRDFHRLVKLLAHMTKIQEGKGDQQQTEMPSWQSLSKLHPNALQLSLNGQSRNDHLKSIELEREILELKRGLNIIQIRAIIEKELKEELGMLPSEREIEASIVHEVEQIKERLRIKKTSRDALSKKDMRKKVLGTIMMSKLERSGFAFYDQNGDTPLTLAIKHKRADFVDALIVKGASINFTDIKGNLPHDVAILYRDKRIAERIDAAMK